MPTFFKNRFVVAKKESLGGWYSRGYFPHLDGEGMSVFTSSIRCLNMFWTAGARS